LDLFAVFIFLIGVLVVAALMLFLMGRAQPRGPALRQEEKKLGKEEMPFRERHVAELFGIDEIYGGIYRKGGRYFGLARLEGTNFSVVSEGEQNAREDVLIYIMSLIDYPIQFISGTVVADTTQQAEEIALRAEEEASEELKTYMFLYAGALQQMKTERRVLSEQSWLVVTDNGEEGDPAKKIREKMYLLKENLRQRARIVLVPLETSEEVIDAIHQMVLPERIVKPSERVQAGVLEPVHLARKDLTGEEVA
jgi:hypothetical protein